ncbi:MAG: hypothetical protein AAB438_00990 [Patescibacteria group bacterium]
MNSMDKLKKRMWHFIYKIFTRTQQSLLKIGLIRHEKGRQPYHIGWLTPGRTLEELKNHLHAEWGFGNHFVAWIDDGQVLSWRKLLNFNDQYHLRVFRDGEIRGHFEFTPEGHPLDHFIEKGEREAKEEFLRFLGDFVVSKKVLSHLEIDPSAFNPDSEITIDNFENKEHEEEKPTI